MLQSIVNLVGPDSLNLSLGQMIVRASIVYFLVLSLVRFNKRLLGIRTVYNYVLYIILGSLLAAAIIGAGRFFPIIGMVTFFVMLNWTIAGLSYYSPFVERLFKGNRIVLIKNGKLQRKAFRNYFITQDDLMDALHTRLSEDELDKVEMAYLENSGKITIIEHK